MGEIEALAFYAITLSGSLDEYVVSEILQAGGLPFKGKKPQEVFDVFYDKYGPGRWNRYQTGGIAFFGEGTKQVERMGFLVTKNMILIADPQGGAKLRTLPDCGRLVTTIMPDYPQLKVFV